jgi:hypothetical protein
MEPRHIIAFFKSQRPRGCERKKRAQTHDTALFFLHSLYEFMNEIYGDADREAQHSSEALGKTSDRVKKN